MSYAEKRSRIDVLQQKIDSYGELSKELKQKINYKFRLDWNYYSNSMEGNTLTMDETRSVMVGNLTVGGKPIRDVLEMKGHDEVISEILRIGKGEIRLSEKRIRQIHKGIMHEEDEVNKSKIGEWKTVPNYVTNYKGEKFDFAAPSDVPDLMHELLNKTNAAIDAIQNKQKPAPHPIDVALQFHLDYIVIHPFYDGNGRTARILTNLLLISFGYPPFWLKTDERNAYYQYLGDIQGYGGNPDLFFDFIADRILRSQNIILDAIDGKEISDTSDLDKELLLLKAELEGSSVLRVESNPMNIAEVIEFNIIPLLRMLEDKCSTLGEFFFALKRRFEFEYDGDGTTRVIGSEDSKWEDIIHNWLRGQVIAEDKKIKHLRYTFELKGFRKTVLAQSFWLNVEIWFNDYNYVIQTDHNQVKSQTAPYEKRFTSEELQFIATPIIRNIIDGIKRCSPQ